VKPDLKPETKQIIAIQVLILFMEIKMNKLMCHHTLKTVYLPLLTCLITIHANAMSDQLYIGETIYLNDPTVTDVVIGNDQIVKAKKVGNKGIALTGVAAGDTTLKVWNGNRYFTSEIHVYPSNVKKRLKICRLR
jgi:pilus assembly protein CpaC